MRSVEEAILEFLTGYSDALKREQIVKQAKTTGQSADSLKETAQDNYGKLTGSHYWYQQRHGRRPGKMPPVESIIEWLKEKKTFRLDEARTPRSLESLAWAIAKSIAKKGTQAYSNVDKRVVVPEKEFLTLREKLLRQIGQTYTTQIRTEIKKI